MNSYEWTHRTAEEKLDFKAEGDQLLFLASGKWLRGNYLGDEAAREILRLAEVNSELRGKVQLLAESGAGAAPTGEPPGVSTQPRGEREMSTDNLCRAARPLAVGPMTQGEMDALCATVLKYGEATGQPGYDSFNMVPAYLWRHLNEKEREALARFVLAEVDQGPAGVVDSKTVWLKEMSAAQIFEAMSEEQRSDFDKMFRTHLIRSMSAGEAWEALSEEQRSALRFTACGEGLDVPDDGSRIAELESAVDEIRKVHGTRLDWHCGRLDELAARSVRDDAAGDSVLTRLEALENKAVPKIAELEQKANRDLQRQLSRMDDVSRSLQDHHERLSILEAAVNRLDVEEVDDERGRGVGQTGGAYEMLEDVHRRLREEHSITSSALEIEKRRADKAEDHLKAILTGMPWEMVREFAEEPPF